MSFVSTSFFSVPVTPLRQAQSSMTEEEDGDGTDLAQLLKQALASSEQLAKENSSLKAENARLQDKLSFLQTTLGETNVDVVDASIGMLRGKLLQQCRDENQALREQHVDLQAKHRITQQQLALERKANLEAIAQTAKLNDVQALSQARANAVDRLDNELVQCKREKFALELEFNKIEAERETFMRTSKQHETELQRLNNELLRERVYVDQLKDKLLTQGLDLRVLQSDFTPSPFKQQQQPQSVQNETARLKQRVADLEHQIARSMHQPAIRDNTHENLRESLALAISELKLSNTEHWRERAKLNGACAARVAKLRKLERHIVKLTAKCREYRFMAKKAQAELVTFVAKRVNQPYIV